jgi:hypothetical protein
MAPLLLLALAAAGGYALIKSQEGKKSQAGGGGFTGSASGTYDANLPPEAARAVDIAIGRGGVPGETDVARLRQFASTLAQYPIAQGAVNTYANALATGMPGAGTPYNPGYTTPATPNTGFGGGGGAPAPNTGFGGAPAGAPGNTGIFGGLGLGLGGAPTGPTPAAPPAANPFSLPPALPPFGGGGGGGGAPQQGPGSPPAGPAAPPAAGSLGALLGSIGLALPGVPATPTPAPPGGTLGQQIGTALGGLGGFGGIAGGLGGLGGGGAWTQRRAFAPVVNNYRTAQQSLVAWNDRTGAGGSYGRTARNEVDGLAGPATKAAITAFQTWENTRPGGARLVVDGLLGPQTYAALTAYGKATP